MKQLAFATLAMFLLPVLFSGCGGDEYSELEEVVSSHDCHFCKEEVKGGAIKCKHCGEDPYNGDDKDRFKDTLFIKSIESVRAERESNSWPWWKYIIAVPCWFLVFLILFRFVFTGGWKAVCEDDWLHIGICVFILWLIW